MLILSRTTQRVLMTLLFTLITICESYRYPLLNDGDVTVKNISDTSVVLVWQLQDDPPESCQNSKCFSLNIKRGDLTDNDVYIYPGNNDKQCSLLLSRCRLNQLAPNTIYRIITYIGNETSTLGRAEVIFLTLPERDFKWWLTYAVAPAAGGVVVTVTGILIFARCCNCCCWRKKRRNQEPSRPSSSSRQVLRSESEAARQWVKDTFRGIEMDPPSVQYDQPIPPSSPSPDHPSYMPVNSNLSSKGIKKKKSKTAKTSENNETDETSIPGQFPASQPSYINIERTSNTSPIERPVKKVFATNQFQLPPLQIKSTEQKNESPDSQKHPQQQQQQNTALYTNTEDLNQLLGSARKMFPML